MRIGILTHNYPRNSREQVGAEVFIYWFAKLLKEKGHEVFVFCPNYYGKKENYKDIPVTWFNWPDQNKKLGDFSLSNPSSLISISIMMLKGSFEVIRFINRNNIDITISMWAFPAGFWGMIGKFMKGKKSVVISMGSDIFVYPKILPAKWLIGFVLKQTNLIYGNGYKICKEIKRISGRTAKFFPIAASDLPKKIKITKMDKRKFNFIYVGRLEPVKGVDILLEAVKIVKQKTDNFCVYLAGPGTMYELLEKKSNEEGLQNNFKLLGFYDREKTAGLFKEADSLVMASRSESTPFTVIEAIYSNLPMVVTEAGDMGKIVRDFKLGFAAPVKSPEKLAEAMYKMIRKGKKYKKRLQKNFAKPQKVYNTHISTEKLLKRIENMI